MNRFDIDNTQQKRIRDLVLGPGLYASFSLEGRYVFVDKGGRLVTLLQKRLAVDTMVQSRRDRGLYCIEEKIVRWPGYEYSCLTLETESNICVGYESEGWMRYGQADFLNYVMCQENGDVFVYLINFPKLQAAFWPVETSFEETITPSTMQLNRSRCRKVPIEWVRKNVGLWPMRIPTSDEGARAVIEYNNSSYRRRAEPPSRQADFFADFESGGSHE
jgi:hypothetical protein